MGWGLDAQTSLAEAKKAGADVSDFKVYDKTLDTLEEMYKIYNLVGPAFSSVEKFLLNPDPAVYRDMKIFFQKRGEFVDSAKKVMPKMWPMIDLAADYEKLNKDNKKASKACGDLANDLRSCVVFVDPKGQNKLFTNIASEAIKNKKKEQDKALKEFEDQQKAELDALETFIDTGVYSRV